MIFFVLDDFILFPLFHYFWFTGAIHEFSFPPKNVIRVVALDTLKSPQSDDTCITAAPPAAQHRTRNLMNPYERWHKCSFVKTSSARLMTGFIERSTCITMDNLVLFVCALFSGSYFVIPFVYILLLFLLLHNYMTAVRHLNWFHCTTKESLRRKPSVAALYVCSDEIASTSVRIYGAGNNVIRGAECWIQTLPTKASMERFLSNFPQIHQLVLYCI